MRGISERNIKVDRQNKKKAIVFFFGHGKTSPLIVVGC